MRKVAAAIMAGFLVFATAAPAKAEQTCQDVAGVGSLCLTVENGKATVTGPLGIDLSATGPTIEVPGPTETVTLPPPAPTTVTRTAAPRTVTQTATATETVTITETASPVTETVTATPTFVSPSLATPPSEGLVGQEQDRPDTIIEQVVRNVGVPLLWIVIGVILAILVQYLMYAMGRSDAKHADDKFLEGILNRKKS